MGEAFRTFGFVLTKFPLMLFGLVFTKKKSVGSSHLLHNNIRQNVDDSDGKFDNWTVNRRIRWQKNENSKWTNWMAKNLTGIILAGSAVRPCALTDCANTARFISCYNYSRCHTLWVEPPPGRLSAKQSRSHRL